jgi:hypothetical protein
MKHILLIVFLSLGLLAMTSKVKSDFITLEGKIEIYGNEPHTYVGIKTKNSVYKIINAKKYNLQNFQNKTLKIKAKIIQNKKGPGFPAVIEIVE